MGIRGRPRRLVRTVAAELIRPDLGYFPTDTATSEEASRGIDSAALAAWLGLIRGDLWTDYAVALASALPGGIVGSAVGHDIEKVRDARSAAERAASLAPENARAWALLAALDTRLGGFTSRVSGPLKMAYYTGPNEVPLMALRLSIASRLDALTDEESQSLVGREIRTIVTRKPKLKPIVVVAYRAASPTAKRFMEGQFNQLDPAFLWLIK